jgi:transposase
MITREAAEAACRRQEDWEALLAEYPAAQVRVALQRLAGQLLDEVAAAMGGMDRAAYLEWVVENRWLRERVDVRLTQVCQLLAEELEAVAGIRTAGQRRMNAPRWVAEQMAKAGATVHEIITTTGAHPAQVREWTGLTATPKRMDLVERYGEAAQERVLQLIAEGLTIPAVAAATQVPYMAVWTWVRQAGITPTRARPGRPRKVAA